MGNPRCIQATDDRHLQGILDLQQRNLEAILDRESVARDGFVTVRHDLELLREMNDFEPHIIALDDGQVVGYALVMAPHFEHRLPIIAPMFEQMRSLQVDGRALEQWRYFVMGQVCVAAELRGHGVFEGLYAHMRDCYSRRFDFILTEVARRNGRSVRAHEKVGFSVWHSYTDEQGEHWDLIGWDWRQHSPA